MKPTFTRTLPPGVGRLLGPTAPISRRDDLLLKSLFFTIWAAVGMFFPFVSVYYRSIGLTGTQIGLIGSLGALSAAFGSTIWGMLNDRYGKLPMIYSLVIGGAIALSQVILQIRSFAVLLPCAAVFSFFNSGLVPLLDSAALRILGEHRQSYGAYRLWGTFGFILTCSISGFTLERTGLSAIFTGYALALAVFWLTTRRLPDRTPGPDVQLFAGLKVMVRNPRWTLFAASILILWLASMAGLGFLAIVIKEMGGGERMVGLNSTIAALAEIPLLVGSSWALRRFGPARLLTIAMLTYGLRMVLYSLMPDYHWALWISLLQSLSYCPFLIGSVAYANELAPEHLKSTSQGLLATIMNLANLFGSPAGGWLFDHAGRATMYLVLAATCFAALALFAGGQAVFKRRSTAVWTVEESL